MYSTFIQFQFIYELPFEPFKKTGQSLSVPWLLVSHSTSSVYPWNCVLLLRVPPGHLCLVILFSSFCNEIPFHLFKKKSKNDNLECIFYFSGQHYYHWILTQSHSSLPKLNFRKAKLHLFQIFEVKFSQFYIIFCGKQLVMNFFNSIA